MPTRFPPKLISGPPLLPGLITVSVWIRSYRGEPPEPPIVRPSAETTPTVTVGPPGSASAFPMAMTHSPTRRLTSCFRGKKVSKVPGILNTARSARASAPTSSAFSWLPSSMVTIIFVAPSMTWLLVNAKPSREKITPVPLPKLDRRFPNRSRTMDSATMDSTAPRTRSTVSATLGSCSIGAADGSAGAFVGIAVGSGTAVAGGGGTLVAVGSGGLASAETGSATISGAVAAVGASVGATVGAGSTSAAGAEFEQATPTINASKTASNCHGKGFPRNRPARFLPE